jgi:ech hydrogenase subunit C
VVGGVDKVIPVDVYIPGCPPKPEAIINGIVKLLNLIKEEGHAEKH